jgi:hypothetical protein
MSFWDSALSSFLEKEILQLQSWASFLAELCHGMLFSRKKRAHNRSLNRNYFLSIACISAFHIHTFHIHGFNLRWIDNIQEKNCISTEHRELFLLFPRKYSITIIYISWSIRGNQEMIAKYRSMCIGFVQTLYSLHRDLSIYGFRCVSGSGMDPWRYRRTSVCHCKPSS